MRSEQGTQIKEALSKDLRASSLEKGGQKREVRERVIEQGGQSKEVRVNSLKRDLF